MGDTEEKILKLEIKMERIFFPKGAKKVESGMFSIFLASISKVVKGDYEEKFIKLKGTVCEIKSDTTYTVTAKLSESNAQYGDTYEIIFINTKAELVTIKQQRDFLEGILHKNLVNELFNTYGEEVIDILEDRDSDSLCKIKGIGAKTALKIIQKYYDTKDYSALYTELKGLDFTYKMINKLLEKYKSPDVIVDLIKTNPYKLIEIDGIGFKKCDEIAIKSGINYDDALRLEGYILFYLNQEAELGRSYVLYSDFMRDATSTLVNFDMDILLKTIQKLIEANIVMVSHEGSRMGLIKYFNLEKNIIAELRRLNTAVSLNFDIKNRDVIISKLEQQQGWSYTEEQKQGIYDILENNITVLTAKAGGGKTTLARAVSEVLSKYSIAQCALSGKASVRISEVTGLEAKTIHKLLGFSPRGGYAYNKDNQLESDVYIVDECSMIDGWLFYRLLQAIPSGSKVILLGDTAQLTAIGSCNVFADIIKSQIIKIIKLEKVHRQGARSGILSTSLQVSNQEPFLPKGFVGSKIMGELQDMEYHIFKDSEGLLDLCVQHYLAHYRRLTFEGKDAVNSIQVITPMRLRGEVCTYTINNQIQKVINPLKEDSPKIECSMGKDKPFIITINDRVVNMKNNYNAVNENGESVAIYNGSTGIVKDIFDDGCIVEFAGIDTVVIDKLGTENLELAYAMTTHKVQGSQSEVAITVFDSSAYVLLNIELLYTAVTRAMKYGVLLTNQKAFLTATTKRESSNKQTYFYDIVKYL